MAAAMMNASLKRSFAEMHNGQLHGHGANLPSSAGSSRQASPSPAPRFENGNLGHGIRNKSAGTEAPCPSAFDPQASVVLIGIRGVGKSSLAILAASAYNRKVVDIERVFSETTGSTPTSFRKQYGSLAFQQRHSEILGSVLDAHASGSIIVGSFSDTEGNGARIIRDFASSHPVIHVTRDVAGIQSHLKTWPLERISRLLQASGPLLHNCCNFDFFNLSEHGPRSGKDKQQAAFSQRTSPAGPFLTLKRVERDFLKFLRNILGDSSRGPSHHSAYPLSLIAVEDRSYTYSARIAVQDVLSETLDLDDAQIGADALELVIDDGENGVAVATGDNPVAKAFAILRRVTILPIILTPDTVKRKIDQEARYRLAQSCLRLGPEFLTVSMDFDQAQLEALLTRKGKSKIIGLFSFPHRPVNGWHNEQCRESYIRMEQLGCNLAKILMPAESFEDSFAAHAFKQQIESAYRSPKLIAYCNKLAGRPSWCFNKILTGVQPAGVSEGLARMLMTESMATSQKLTKALYATFLQEPMRFLIYGANTSYSLSPAMHNAAYDACGMPHIYDTISSSSLEQLQRIAQSHSFGGAAITQPFKTGVLSMTDALSPHARAIGAVNTIIPIRKFAADGAVPDEVEIINQRNQRGPVLALYGHNTDWIGIRACIRRGLSPANTVRAQSTGLVCGAGGMARAAVYSMLSLGVKNVFVCNRTTANAQALADHYNNLVATLETVGLDSRTAQVHVIESFTDEWPTGYRQPSMIVIGIPAQPTDGSSPANFTLPERWLRSSTGGVVVELAYRPLQTLLVQQMRKEAHRGFILMDGFDMLPEQGFAQFELFTGRRAPRKVMRDEVVKMYQKEQEANASARAGLYA